jgi:ATP-binding cassette, subfamily B, bacterial
LSSSHQQPASTLRRVWQFSAGLRLPWLLAIGGLVIATLLNFIIPLIGSATIDLVLGANPGPPASLVVAVLGGAARVNDNLWLPGLAMVALTVVSGLATYLKSRGAAAAAEGIARRLREQLHDHLQHLPVRYHDRADSGDLIQRCTSDVETLRLALSSQVVDISNALLLIIVALPLMLWLDVRMTAVSVALLLPLILFGYLYFKRVGSVFRTVDEAEGKVTTVIQENLNGLRVVRAFARQTHEIEKFAGPNAEYRDCGLRLVRLMAWYWGLSDLVALSQNGLSLLAGIWWIRDGSLSVGTLFAFLMFLNLLLWPVRMMGRILTDLGKTQVAVSRIAEILDEAVETDPPHAQPPAHPVAGRLELRCVSFAHQAGVPALADVSFAVEPGQTLAILGPSGAGKSTLMSLLLRLYDGYSGQILVDGHELQAMPRAWARACFSPVLQEPFLYSKTIHDNIALAATRSASGGPPIEHLMHAAAEAHIHQTIESFPAGYQTPLGERGVTLSGGQRQRIALARAFLRDAPILLLDDALSAVDAETEERILDVLRTRHRRKTTLVIAHRLSTLAHADLIIVLEQGRITQRGTHHALMNEDGLYRRLWSMQQGIATADGDAASAPEADA